MTTYTQRMLDRHPMQHADPRLVAAIDALEACAQACNICADACLSEAKVADLRRCIALNLDCADICTTAARVLSRSTAGMVLLREQLELGIAACEACASECEQHSEMHAHCRICAEACRACIDACRGALGGV